MLKDFNFGRPNGRFTWKNIGEGDIDWPEVRRALADIKYSGYVTTEIAGGDEAYLKDVSQRVDRFLAGEKPLSEAQSATIIQRFPSTLQISPPPVAM